MFRRASFPLSVGLAFAVAGCSDDFPNFGWSPLTGSHIYEVPATEVARQVRCELAEFLDELNRHPQSQPGKGFQIDPNETAAVTLTLQTNVEGKLNYFGIDLDKFGLDGLARLIKLNSSNVPDLNAGFTSKNSVTAEVKFSMPQTIAPAGPKCDAIHQLQARYRKLYLTEWLLNFYRDFDLSKEPAIDDVSLGEITLTSKFVLAVNVGAGGLYSPFGTVYILPISNVTGNLTPDRSNELKVVIKSTKAPPKGPLLSSKKTTPRQKALDKAAGTTEILLREILLELEAKKRKQPLG